MRHLKENNMVDWPKEDCLHPDYFEINRALRALDDLARGYEAKWGIGYLEQAAGPQLAEKWERQGEKMQDAIDRRDVNTVRALYEGTVRGWKALELAAIDGGHKPRVADCWESVHPESGKVYIICKNNMDAAAASRKGCVTMSLEEVVRVLESVGQLGEVKEAFPGAVIQHVGKDDGDIEDELGF